MKRLWVHLLGIACLLVLVYAVGPTPPAPQLAAELPEVPARLAALDSGIREWEAQRPVRPDNQARIVWADSLRPQVTDLAVVYLHGLTASQAEGHPVHRNVAKALGANLFLARLRGHGLDVDSPLVNLTADAHYASARHALAIGRRLGRRVVLLGTSAGGALALKLAADFPDAVAAVVLYAPAVALYDPSASLLDRPWGREIAQQVVGSEWLGWQQDSLSDRYWYRRYHLQGAIALQTFIRHAMTEETFQNVRQPVLLAYYYRDDAHQDQTVSVEAMRTMFAQLGTPDSLKQEAVFPQANAHVLTSSLKTEAWPAVQATTIAFLRRHLLPLPHPNPTESAAS